MVTSWSYWYQISLDNLLAKGSFLFSRCGGPYWCDLTRDRFLITRFRQVVRAPAQSRNPAMEDKWSLSLVLIRHTLLELRLSVLFGELC